MSFFIFYSICLVGDLDISYLNIALVWFWVTNNFSPSLEIFATPARGFYCCKNRTPPHQNHQACNIGCMLLYYFVILCGLWFGQDLLLHLSGMVLVPSIISALHMWQMLPVGFAFIAFLQSG